MVRVRALRAGFDGLYRREQGEEFDLPQEIVDAASVNTWFEVV